MTEQVWERGSMAFSMGMANTSNAGALQYPAQTRSSALAGHPFGVLPTFRLKDVGMRWISIASSFHAPRNRV